MSERNTLRVCKTLEIPANHPKIAGGMSRLLELEARIDNLNKAIAEMLEAEAKILHGMEITTGQLAEAQKRIEKLEKSVLVDMMPDTGNPFSSSR